MSISKIFFIGFLFISSFVSGQYQIQELTTQKGVSIRSLAVPSQNVIWASGSKGMIAKSTNEGKSFEWMQVKGYEKRDLEQCMLGTTKKQSLLLLRHLQLF